MNVQKKNEEQCGAGWWFQTFFIFHFIYGMSSFPLTNSYFSRWLLHHQPGSQHSERMKNSPLAMMHHQEFASGLTWWQMTLQLVRTGSGWIILVTVASSYFLLVDNTQTDRQTGQTGQTGQTDIHTYVYIYIHISNHIYMHIYICVCVFLIYIYTHKGVNMFVTTTMHVCVRSSQIWWYSTTCNSYPYLPRNGFSEMTVWQRRFGNLLCFLQIYACNNFSMGQWYLSTV